MLNSGSSGRRCIVQTAIFSSKKAISLKSVHIAMYRLAKRHPLLRMKIKRSISDDTDNDWFLPMDKMEVKIEELPDKIWQDVMEQHLSESRINVEEGPLWYVKFLPNIYEEDTHVKLQHQFALIFVFDHAICDGNSILRLINETLLYLEDEINGVENYDKIESLPLPKSICDLTGIEDRLPLSLKIAKILISWFPSIIGWTLAKKYFKDNNLWITNINKNHLTPTVVPGTKMITMTFNQSETTQFMKSCKVHNVSPGAAFQSALLTILSEKLSLSEAEFRVSINLRQHHPKFKADNMFQQIAYHSTILWCKTKIPKTKKHWTLAKYCKQALHDNLVSRIGDSLQLLSVFRGIPGDILASEPQKSDSLVAFHNYGNCSFLNRGDNCSVRVTAMHGCIPLHKKAGPLFHAHCCCLEKQFFFGLAYSTSIISKETALEISEYVKQKIIQEIK